MFYAGTKRFRLTVEFVRQHMGGCVLGAGRNNTVLTAAYMKHWMKDYLANRTASARPYSSGSR